MVQAWSALRPMETGRDSVPHLELPLSIGVSTPQNDGSRTLLQDTSQDTSARQITRIVWVEFDDDLFASSSAPVAPRTLATALVSIIPSEE